MENESVNHFVDELCGIDPNTESEVNGVEEKYNCSISCSIEKHNALQHTYFYEVDFNESELLYIEIESGINNGTQINNVEWGVDTKQATKIIEVLNDIKLKEGYYEKGSLLYRKAQAVLDANKNELLEFHRKNDYGNYVTGGNSKMKLDPLLQKLKLDYIYEPQEVNCNFI
jgi:hypothetical protein